MATDIPEYYRHLAENRPERQAPGGRRAAGGPEIDAPEVPFRADAFNINLYEGWTDKSVYILAGPVDDGIQHNITITLDPDVPIDSLSRLRTRRDITHFRSATYLTTIILLFPTRSPLRS